MTDKQKKRVAELREYAEKQRLELGYGRVGYDEKQVSKWTNVLAWLILIEKGE